MSKGCEVKRETLNLVVSPVRKGFGRAEALVMAAGNRDQNAKDEYWSNRSGVADSIEQHMVNWDKPGWSERFLALLFEGRRVGRTDREREDGRGP